ncbi:MAG: NnrS family protein [Asgard group archaeon]|nr:NnrS family protein [Asgard group archaeon]
MRTGDGIVGIDEPARVERFKKVGTYAFLFLVLLTALCIAGGVLLYIYLVPGDSAPLAYVIGSLLFVMGLIFLVLSIIFPRTINQSYLVVSQLQKEYRIDDLRHLARQTMIGTSLRQNQQKRLAIAALGDLKIVDAIPDLEWAFRSSKKEEVNLIRFIAEALAKIGTSYSADVLKNMSLLLQENLAEKQKVKLKSKYERSSIILLSNSLRQVNNYLIKLTEKNSFSTVDELFSSIEDVKHPSTISSYQEDYSSQPSFTRELSQAEILSSQSLLGANKFFLLTRYDIISLLLLFLGILPGIISFLVFLPIRIRYWRIRRLIEEKNVTELVRIVRECKTSFYGQFATKFAIYALGDLRKVAGIAALKELSQKWDSSWSIANQKLSRYQTIIKEAVQTLDYVNKIIEGMV